MLQPTKLFCTCLALLASASLPVVLGDVILRGATIATWNDSSQAIEVYREASLHIRGDEIVEIYKDNDTIPSDGVEIVDMTDKIIVPGFINTHQHVWQTLYKTLVPNLPFASYFPRLGHIAPISSTLTADDVYRSELMGALEIMNEGTTSWIDITAALSQDTVEAALQATFDSGGRSFFAATLQERANFSMSQQIDQIKNISTRQELQNSSLVTLGLSYDGYDGATSTDREKVLDLVHSGSVDFLTTHYVGGPFGNTNSPELLHREEWSLLNDTRPIVFSHSSELSPLDAWLLRQTNQYISIAPESEQHAGHGNPHSHLILDQATLASDSVFAYSTSLVHQARMWLQLVRGRLQQLLVDQWSINIDTPMTVNQAFYLATRAGGLALRRPDLGVIAVGAKADLVAYDTTGVDLLGWRDPVAAVILHSNPRDISDVVVGGQFTKRNFTLTYGNYEQLRSDFKKSAQTFTDRYYSWDFGELPRWFYLATYKDAQAVDVVRGNATGY